MMPAPSASTPIDRVDEADRPIGEVRRGEVFAQAAGFRVVHIFVFDQDGQLLLQQLGRERERNPLKWGSSVAGYLRSGEDYIQGAQRRLREELGLTTPLAKFGSTVMPDQGARKFITLYVTRADRLGVTVAEPGHIEALRLRPVADIEAAITREPANFTETFRFLFRFYLSTLRLTGVEEWRGLGAPVP
jgi:isopentenyl-diphosphate delta-isomerase